MHLPNDLTSHLATATQRIEPWLIATRRDIHAHPELGFEEVRTAGIVAAELSRLGIAHRTGVGRTGIVAEIKGGRPGKTLAIRADMDALPIHEETGQEFASTIAGKMHACGHDIHTATLLGVAEVLRDLAPELSGNIRLIFQPAEEILEGAPAMIADGAADGVDMALGFHNMPDMPVGGFGYVRGMALAASDRFDIIVQGKSGHAAHPYASVDPIVAAAQLITQLQTVVSREQRAIHPCVVTVGMVQGGATYNIIPERVHLKGTVRTLHPEARDVAEAAIRRLCEGIAAGLRCGVDVTYRRLVPSLRNDDRVLEPAIRSVENHFGLTAEEKPPSMGAEDFSAFADRVPSFHLLVGAGAPGRDDRLHNAHYQPDEACIGLGVQALSRIAVDMLRA
ncbi:MAG: M20 family metallopeptidase [Alphaproteobacteria bacterium]|nr:M20 family metallopeptidase [Alphaproteobacteria bacterium]